MKKIILLLSTLLIIITSFAACLSVDLPDTITWDGQTYFASGHRFPDEIAGFVKIGSQNGNTIYENQLMSKDSIFFKTAEGYVQYDWEFKPQIMKKPNIYLYPKATLEIQVSLEFDGKITSSYPKYNKGWRVMANPEGILINKADGKEYSYLFWEGEYNSQWDVTSGFVVKGDDSADFLQEKLSFMGLTPREYNEFIVYWLPELEKNKYNLISFVNEEYAQEVKLNVSPKPDSVLRVFMVYKELDRPIKINPQILKPFKREGFTVVEWGGGELSE